nr:ribonuclease H-like domain-containing protein [Tanacetum cinerariifolium]
NSESQTLSGPPLGVHLVPGSSQSPVQFTTGVQQQQGGSFPVSVHLGQSPSMPFHPSQLFASGSQVGDEHFIPVTNSGHSVLSTPFRSLRLNNVLITPNIVKNLISVPPGFLSVSAQLSAQPTYREGFFPGSVHLGQSPSMPFHPSQLFASGSQGSGQATLLPNAFNTTTLQDPASGNWNMDTGASSHLNDSVHCHSDILNMCIYPSVAVGDEHFILVTNSGHSVLSTPFHPLRLNNVLICNAPLRKEDVMS